jgi:hypothetical protein
MYKFSAYAPKEYRKWLADKLRPLAIKHGLQRGKADPATGAVRVRALAKPAQIDVEPTLF